MPFYRFCYLLLLSFYQLPKKNVTEEGKKKTWNKGNEGRKNIEIKENVKQKQRNGSRRIRSERTALYRTNELKRGKC